jgi:ribosome maturation protein Sdo1
MKSVGFMLHPTKNVKQQFLDCVRLLQEKKLFSIHRAKMLLVIVLHAFRG